MIIWGKRTTRRKLGRVAEFCFLCRRPRNCELIRVGRAFHIWFIPFGEGDLLRHDARCETCGVPRAVDETKYLAISDAPLLDIKTLIRDTHPDFEREHGQRLGLERKVRENRLTEEQRWDLLIEPFGVLNPVLKEYERDPKLSPAGRYVVSVTAALLLLFAFSARLSLEAGSAAFGLFFIGGCATVFFMSTARRSHFRRIVEPALVRALLPLRPTRVELEAVLKGLKNSLIAKRLRARRLSRLLEEAWHLSTE